jgi:hypothetical protein
MIAARIVEQGNGMVKENSQRGLLFAADCQLAGEMA